MRGKTARKCRSLAMKEAKRQNLWSLGRSELLKKFLPRLLDKLFKSVRKKNNDIIARFYKSNVKRWSHEAYSNLHDRDILAFRSAQKKLRKQFNAKIERDYIKSQKEKQNGSL